MEHVKSGIHKNEEMGNVTFKKYMKM